MAAMTGKASTRRAARSIGTVSVPSGCATAPMIEVASSKLIIELLFARKRLRSTAPSRTARALAGTSRVPDEAYPWGRHSGRVDHELVYRADRSDDRSGSRAAQGPGQAARAGGDRRSRKPGGADPDRRDPDGRKLSRGAARDHLPQ